jgi:hypothetical protein
MAADEDRSHCQNFSHLFKFCSDCFLVIKEIDNLVPYPLCLSPESMNVDTCIWQVFWLNPNLKAFPLMKTVAEESG